jgi:hypothetical protein
MCQRTSTLLERIEFGNTNMAHTAQDFKRLTRIAVSSRAQRHGDMDNVAVGFEEDTNVTHVPGSFGRSWM